MYVDGEHKQVRGGSEPQHTGYTAYADSWSWSSTVNAPSSEVSLGKMTNGEWSNTKMYSVGLTAAEVLQTITHLKIDFKEI